MEAWSLHMLYTSSVMLCCAQISWEKYQLTVSNIHSVEEMTVLFHFLRLFDDVLASGISSDDELEVNACDNLTSRALRKRRSFSSY